MRIQTKSPDVNFKNLVVRFNQIDPRYVVLTILVFYLFMGMSVLGFNRTPGQALVTTFLTCFLEVSLSKIFKKQWIFPLSALITSCSLSILLNYSHNYWILLLPVFFAIGSKYIFTLDGKHVFNPAQIAVTLSLLVGGGLISVAPAYQWNGIESFSIFIAMLGIFFLLPRIDRHWLVLSFLFFFTLQTFLRAMIMKHHLPFETLFLGTLTSAPFFLFTFFMITDPATSPKNHKMQIFVGFAIATIDLLFHLRQSYFTFFFAGATVQTSRLLYGHVKAMIKEKSFFNYFLERFIRSGYYLRLFFLTSLLGAGFYIYKKEIAPTTSLYNLDLSFEELPIEKLGIKVEMGDVLKRVDPRIQHLAKWLISVGDSVSSADVNNDGFQDLFFSFPLKADGYRNALYLNKGDFNFEKIALPSDSKSREIEENGLGSSGIFVDYDNDGDQDLFITYAFGTPVMLKNLLIENGVLSFLDVTQKIGLNNYTNSIGANFFDFNNDGLLDLFMANVWPEFLPDYSKENPQRLNLFKLPEEEYKGDERMFNFMHASWHMANNGGTNHLYLQQKDGTFKKLDSQKLNLKETRWSLAVATADFNQDGWTDLYVANDFGADDYYLNKNGKFFENIKGEMFGDIGKDTYKGMNTTISDFDNNGTQDVYISNVHHEYQAEGSLLWMWYRNKKNELEPKEMATKTRALNENRFGWGAAAADLDLNGWTDLIQANGMVDDTIDKKWNDCPDYWYVNEKIARSAPSYHRFINKWGDIRGFCIYGKEKNRVYLNNLDKEKIGKTIQFTDVADFVGVDKKTNSRGIAATDLNNDGKVDFVVTHMFSGPSFYKNNLNSKNNFIGLDLESLKSECNRDAQGSIISLTANEITQTKEQVIVNGFNAQSEKRLVFGLGEYTGPVTVKVNWCGKNSKEYTFKEINKYHKVIYQ